MQTTKPTLSTNQLRQAFTKYLDKGIKLSESEKYQVKKAEREAEAADKAQKAALKKLDAKRNAKISSPQKITPRTTREAA